MDQQKVDMYLIANQKYFPPEKTAYLRERLLAAPDDRLVLLSTADLKDPTTLLLRVFRYRPLYVRRYRHGRFKTADGRLLRHTDHYRLVYRIGQNERAEFKQCPAAFVRKTFLSATRFTCFWRRFGALFPIKRIFTA